MHIYFTEDKDTDQLIVHFKDITCRQVATSVVPLWLPHLVALQGQWEQARGQISYSLGGFIPPRMTTADY